MYKIAALSPQTLAIATQEGILFIQQNQNGFSKIGKIEGIQGEVRELFSPKPGELWAFTIIAQAYQINYELDAQNAPRMVAIKELSESGAVPEGIEGLAMIDKIIYAYNGKGVYKWENNAFVRDNAFDSFFSQNKIRYIQKFQKLGENILLNYEDARENKNKIRILGFNPKQKRYPELTSSLNRAPSEDALILGNYEDKANSIFWFASSARLYAYYWNDERNKIACASPFLRLITAKGDTFARFGLLRSYSL